MFFKKSVCFLEKVCVFCLSCGRCLNEIGEMIKVKASISIYVLVQKPREIFIARGIFTLIEKEVAEFNLFNSNCISGL